LCNQTESNNESKVHEEHALFTSQFKGKCYNCGKIGHKAFQCKSKKGCSERPNDGGPQPLFCTYSKTTGHAKPNFFKLNRRAQGNGGVSVRAGFADNVFNSMLEVSEVSEFSDNIYILDIKEVSERITVGNSKTTEATKI